MSTQKITCVTIRCDGCGAEYRTGDEEYVPHWGTVEEARQAVADAAGGYDGWQFAADGTDLCGGCVIRRHHEANGHDWGDWHAVESLSGVEGLERRRCIYFDGGEQYRRHGQRLDHDTVRNLLAEVRASSEGGERP